jgi:excisionase family DNA binding protein
MAGRPPDNLDKEEPSGATQDRLGAQTMTVEEVARLYGVPPAILRRAIERGDLTSVSNAPAPVLLSRAAVLAWLKERRAGWA